MHKKCNGIGGYNVCLHKGNNEIGIGKFIYKGFVYFYKKLKESRDLKILQYVIGNGLQISFDQEKFSFRFEGDSCDASNEVFTVEINMKCDEDANKDTEPEIVPYVCIALKFFYI